MARDISINEAFAIIQRVYSGEGWRPDNTTTREQRNEMFAGGVACVYYGHSTYNPNGGDPRWNLKNGGAGRPQSDDVIVFAPTRAYYDLIQSAGAANWSWNLASHSEPLPAEQQVYPPSSGDLPGGGVVTPPPVDPPVTPPVTPPTVPGDTALILALLRQIDGKLDAVLAGQAAAQSQQAADTAQIGTWMVEQAQGVVSSVVGDLTPKIAATKCRLSLRGES